MTKKNQQKSGKFAGSLFDIGDKKQVGMKEKDTGNWKLGGHLTDIGSKKQEGMGK